MRTRQTLRVYGLLDGLFTAGFLAICLSQGVPCGRCRVNGSIARCACGDGCRITGPTGTTRHPRVRADQGPSPVQQLLAAVRPLVCRRCRIAAWHLQRSLFSMFMITRLRCLCKSLMRSAHQQSATGLSQSLSNCSCGDCIVCMKSLARLTHEGQHCSMEWSDSLCGHAGVQSRQEPTDRQAEGCEAEGHPERDAALQMDIRPITTGVLPMSTYELCTAVQTCSLQSAAERIQARSSLLNIHGRPSPIGQSQLEERLMVRQPQQCRPWRYH